MQPPKQAQARIYKPAKTAMQSGTANTKEWVLEFERESRPFIEHIMGWTGTGDMNRELVLYFHTEDEAVAFAKKHHIATTLTEPKTRKINIHPYADNFSFKRVKAFTRSVVK